MPAPQMVWRRFSEAANNPAYGAKCLTVPIERDDRTLYSYPHGSPLGPGAGFEANR